MAKTAESNKSHKSNKNNKSNNNDSPSASTKAPGMSTPTKVLLLSIVIQVVLLLCPQPKLDPREEIALPLARSYTATHDEPLQGLTILITGPTSGIGKGVAKLVSGMGATVIAVGRSPTKLQQLSDDLPSHVDTFVADFADLEQVSAACDQILAKYERIDMILANAGVHYGWRTFGSPSTAQGVDQVYGVNYLSHFVLIEKLIPLLEQGGHKPRLVFVSSFFHYAVNAHDVMGTLTDAPSSAAASSTSVMPSISPPPGIFADRPCPHPLYRDQYMYGASKVSLMLYAHYLQRQHPQIKVVSVDPGWVATHINGSPGTPLYHPQQWLSFDVYDGWGLVSILHAMFNTTAVPAQSGGSLYWSNAKNYKILPAFLNLESKLSSPILQRLYRQFRVRDAYTALSGFVLGYTQRFFYHAYPSHVAEETLDPAVQENVVAWTRQMVAQWL